MWGNALPWKTTELTPNLGRIDATDDMRPGMGEGGVANLRKFVREGGLLVAAEDSAVFAIDVGLAPGVFVTPTDDLKVVGSVLQAKFVDRRHPVASGYRSEEHTSELQSLMRISYAVFCLKKKKKKYTKQNE